MYLFYFKFPTVEYEPDTFRAGASIFTLSVIKREVKNSDIIIYQ